MFRRAASRVATVSAPRALFSAAARVPSIKFTHGARAQIEAQLKAAALVTPAHFATFTAGAASSGVAPAVAAASAGSMVQTVGPTVVVGGKKTTTIYMPASCMTDPFGRPAMAFDEATIAMIDAGGAVDPPVKKDAKGGKGGKPAKK